MSMSREREIPLDEQRIAETRFAQVELLESLARPIERVGILTILGSIAVKFVPEAIKALTGQHLDTDLTNNASLTGGSVGVAVLTTYFVLDSARANIEKKLPPNLAFRLRWNRFK